MTFKVCVNLLGLASACILTTLSSRISEEIHRGHMLSTAIRLTHLFTFGTWLGMQFWVTFIAGKWARISFLISLKASYRETFSPFFKDFFQSILGETIFANNQVKEKIWIT